MMSANPLDVKPPASRWIALLGIALAALIGAGCGSGGTPTADTGTAMPDDPQGVNLPTNLPIATPTLREGGADAEVIPTNEYGLPMMLTGYEIIAANAGEAVYSGYSCTISPVGCACEQPVIERISFTFPDNDHVIYAFAGEGYATSWEMVRIGPSNWSYTQHYVMEGTEMQIAHIILLTFTDTGFVRNDGAQLPSREVIPCPDVHFRRMPMPTLEPSP